jgi:hypothetical protein
MSKYCRSTGIISAPVMWNVVATDLCLRRRDDTTSNKSGDEIKESMFQMEHNKAPGPDGFSAEFYHVFWEIIKEDLLILFSEFYEESLPLFSLNFGVITLLPKIQDVKQIQ